MLDTERLRAKPNEIVRAARLKGVETDTSKILALDKKRRDLQLRLDEIRAELNKAGAEMSTLAGETKKRALAKLKKTSQEESALKPQLAELDDKLTTALSTLPNPPLPDVPEGKDESQNVEVKKWGQPKRFDFPTLDHVALGRQLDLIDIERAGKTSGSRFYFLKNEAVELEFALIQFALNLLLREGFTPVVAPVLVKRPTMWSGGYLEHGGENEIYTIEKDELYLVGTSEQTMVGYHLDEILDEKDLPERFAAFSTCFRREAGSYGKDTRGIFRVHQFDKLEMFSFTKGDLTESKKEHDYFLSLQEKIVQGLGLPYRVVQMCTGDLGMAAASKFDIEVHLPGQERYRETHSTSNTTDFQARRAKIRYRSGGETKFVHTVNGTAVAVGRLLIAILENYQEQEGSIVVPDVLRQYIGKKVISRK